MKIIVTSLILGVVLVFCSDKLQSNTSQNQSVIDLINAEHQGKVGIKKGSALSSYDSRVFEIRKKAVQLFGIVTDTSKINRFIIMDIVSFEGGKTTYGEILLNDTVKYLYKTPFLSKEVEKSDHPVESEGTIIKYLKSHRFRELETLANERGKTLSGSNFIYVGMYEKGMDSIYVQLLPGFISK